MKVRDLHIRAPAMEEMGDAVAIDERFRLMADHSPVLLWMAREDSLCTFFNATWLSFTGRTLEEEWGVGWSEGVHAEDFQKCMDTYIAAFNRREKFEMIYRLKRHDGEYRWILDRGTPVFDKEVFTGYIGSCVDITEMKDAREKLEQNEAGLQLALEEVQRSNVELENFAYLASHDLQAPLRAIASFSALISEKMDFSKDPELGEYFNILMKSSREMKGLIEALLAYSRIGAKGDSPMESVDLNTLIRDILKADLADATHLEVRYESLPIVQGRSVLLKRLFVNLLENAHKFRKPNQNANVSIECQKEDKEWRISVRDDGIGIDNLYFEKIFKIFTRCHPQSNVNGMGIGLAICKKVIEIHGGKIWVESVPNEGTVFHLTIPFPQEGVKI